MSVSVSVYMCYFRIIAKLHATELSTFTTTSSSAGVFVYVCVLVCVCEREKECLCVYVGVCVRAFVMDESKAPGTRSSNRHNHILLGRYVCVCVNAFI